jgi:group I intron endonuclease
MPNEEYNDNNSLRLNNFWKSKNLNPLVIYDKLDQDSTKRILAEETKGLSGIYLILNKETLSYYIGSASTNRFNSRFTSHLIYFTGSKILKNSVKKFGLNSFCFIILELFSEIVNQDNNKKLLNLEDFYLKSLLPDYNILTEAGLSFGYKDADVYRLKMDSVYSEQYRQDIGSLNKSQILLHKPLDAISQAVLNRNKLEYSRENLNNKGNYYNSIIVKELNGVLYGEFNSILDTAKALNCSNKTIYRALKSPSKLVKKHWTVNYA